jgi:hypothetical protein
MKDAMGVPNIIAPFVSDGRGRLYSEAIRVDRQVKEIGDAGQRSSEGSGDGDDDAGHSEQPYQ